MDAAHKDLFVPEFKGTIPSHMMKNLSEHNKFVLEQLSLVKNQNTWQTHTISKIYKYTRHINDKVLDLEHFRQRMLLEIELDEKWKIREEKYNKAKKIAVILFLALLYPIYIFLVDQIGLDKLIEGFINVGI
jgi:hypothetical protein